MNVANLKEQLTGIPNTALVYSCSDHGQAAVQTGGVSVTDMSSELLPYDDDCEIHWRQLGEIPVDTITAVRLY